MHYSVVVIGNGALDELMEPFDESKDVDEYLVGKVERHDIDLFLESYPESKGKTFDELYALHGQGWNGGRWRKCEDGEWYEYSTYNPNSQWDWYEVGGRWPGKLELKEGSVRIHPINFSWGWDAKEKEHFFKTRKRPSDYAPIRDIDNLDTLTAYAVVKDGEWIVIEGEKVAPYLEGVDEDTFITCVDCHF